MRRGLLFIALGALALAEAPLYAQRGLGDDLVAANKGWLFSLAGGKIEARRSKKPLMVVFRCVP
jgi:hypothetical protein